MRSQKTNRWITIILWLSAVLSAALVLISAYGVITYAEAIRRGDPSARGDLGATLFVFMFAAMLASLPVLKAVPRARRNRVAIGLSVVILIACFGWLVIEGDLNR